MRIAIRIAIVVICFAVAAWVATYGEPLIRHNADAIVILITVFTVMAGFLVAIISILGDPALIPEGSWRSAEVRRDAIEARLVMHVWLFVAYLLAIALLFAGVVVRDAPENLVSEAAKIWIGRGYLFCGVASFLFTFGLARSLLTFQVSRIDVEIRRRRSRDGIKD